MLKFSQKFQDFFFSFGLMFIGLFLLFIFSVTIENKKTEQNFFPKAAERKEYFLTASTSEKFPDSRPVWPLKKEENNFSGTSTAAALLAIDVQTDRVLFEKKSEELRPLASITKLMTAMTLLDLPIDWNTSTIIIEEDCDSSSHQLKAGDNLKLSDLWNVALVGSSNSAIKTLVRNSGFSEENFAALMNKKAKELKLASLSFSEPTGLSSKNIGNAKDIAGLLKESLKSEKILKSLQIGEYFTKPLNNEKPRKIYSTNWLLTDWIPNQYAANCIAGKTGFINDSGYNFVVRLTDEKKHQIIVVVLGAASNEARFLEARDLGNWIFHQYVWPDEIGYNELDK
ncbi:MAG TPA: serine hydrolase [Candidatus Magasanikbacteria bacterium]|nr:serine hydrolase [Candidatus Magasanikbacteria bacterium]